MGKLWPAGHRNKGRLHDTDPRCWGVESAGEARRHGRSWADALVCHPRRQYALDVGRYLSAVSCVARGAQQSINPPLRPPPTQEMWMLCWMLLDSPCCVLRAGGGDGKLGLNDTKSRCSPEMVDLAGHGALQVVPLCLSWWSLSVCRCSSFRSLSHSLSLSHAACACDGCRCQLGIRTAQQSQCITPCSPGAAMHTASWDWGKFAGW